MLTVLLLTGTAAFMALTPVQRIVPLASPAAAFGVAAILAALLATGRAG